MSPQEIKQSILPSYTALLGLAEQLISDQHMLQVAPRSSVFAAITSLEAALDMCASLASFRAATAAKIK